MNIGQAKEQIKRAVEIYLDKDEFGKYRIPVVRQRPVFLLGAPGIGKTAIMEQVADELGIALVSYSMTHHTRQSMLGLPVIKHKEFDGQEYDVSEYTMSEIIASVYETIEASGRREGILFLDEINCVSETLSPSMLQFLQFKTFGKHRVPDGWVIITAGNPPQFNRSVKEFDVVTMDRMKVIDVEADYDTWREYAVGRGLHGSIITYLDINKADFYVVESTGEGKSYVTARGWEDLSDAIYLFEAHGFPVDEALVGQYLRHKRIVRYFAMYYELYTKYRNDYRIYDILGGNADDEIRNRAREAAFDERVSLIGLLMDAAGGQIAAYNRVEDGLKALHPVLKALRGEVTEPQRDVTVVMQMISDRIKAAEDGLAKEDASGVLSEREHIAGVKIAAAMEAYEKGIRVEGLKTCGEAMAYMEQSFAAEVADMRAEAEAVGHMLSNLFAFMEDVFGDGREMLILVTDLTASHECARFLNAHGCDEYFAYNKKYQLYERQKEIADAVDRLQL